MNLEQSGLDHGMTVARPLRRYLLDACRLSFAISAPIRLGRKVLVCGAEQTQVPSIDKVDAGGATCAIPL